jgi:protein-disulfide isomerase
MHRSLLCCTLLFAVSGFAAPNPEALAAALKESRPTDLVLGPNDAPVVVVSYVEFHGNPMTKYWIDAWGPLHEKFPNVKFVLRDFFMAFHPGAELNARAAHGVYELAGADAFVKFAGLIALHRGEYTVDLLAGFAARAGVTDAAAFKARLQKGDWSGPLLVNASDVSTAGITGTPSSWINGVQFRELHNLANFTTALESVRGLVAAPKLKELVIQSGRSIGPFQLGMSMAQVKALGFRLKETERGWWLVAINSENDDAPLQVRFEGDKLTRLHLSWQGSTVPVLVGGKKLAPGTDMESLGKQLGCKPIEYGEGGNLMKCGLDEVTFGSAACRTTLTKGDCNKLGTPGYWAADYRVIAH